MPDAFHAPSYNLSRVVHTGPRFPGPTAVLLAASLLTSCAVFRHRAPPTAPSATAANSPATAPASDAAALASAPTPAIHRVGTVRVIGHAQRFVLIEVPPLAPGALPDGQLLRCAADPAVNAPTTATLRVGRERRRPYVVADVVSGEPHLGDTVFTAATPAMPTHPGPLVLPTATSGVLPIALPDATPAPANPPRP